MKESLILLLLFSSCTMPNLSSREAIARKEIIQTEAAFEETARKMGLTEAFHKFADSSAVIIRSNKLIKGKSAIRDFYQSRPSDNSTLTWKPDTVILSAKCDIGYTYGSYTYSARDSTGKVIASTGIFHTIWKKQPDGSWRYTWD